MIEPVSEQKRIVVTGQIAEQGISVLRDAGAVWSWDHSDPIPLEERDRRLADADAAVTLLTDRVDDAFLDAAPNLRIVANVAVGHDNIDVEACRGRDVIVTNTPGVLTDATADLAMGLLLMITRRMGEGERLVRSGVPWEWGMHMMLGTGLQGRRLGIVGMGAIGRALASRAVAFGMDIVYHNRNPVGAEVERRLEARFVPLTELLATSDVVSLNCPHTPDTHHLLDAAAFASMRSDAFVVNTARGAVIDEAALVDALDRREIAGAALDVYENEPVVHPGLLGRDDVALLPHLGSATSETRGAMAELAARNVAAVLDGRPPITAVG